MRQIVNSFGMDVIRPFSKQNSNSTDTFLTKGVCANNEEILAELFN